MSFAGLKYLLIVYYEIENDDTKQKTIMGNDDLKFEQENEANIN